MPAYAKNLAGQKAGMLTAIEDVGLKAGKRQWRCRCDCGSETTIPSARFGLTLSCGCMQRAAVGASNEARSRHLPSASTDYKSWRSMLDRCRNPKSPNFHLYGGRGITVAPEWVGPEGFSEFSRAMGPRPKGTSLDRIDNDGDYAPGNCRWADATTQSKNRRNTPEAAAMRKINLANGRKYWPRKEVK